MYLLLA